MFNEKLNEYMALIGCSGRELAKYSGISEASVSRYKSGGARSRARIGGFVRTVPRNLCGS